MSNRSTPNSVPGESVEYLPELSRSEWSMGARISVGVGAIGLLLLVKSLTPGAKDHRAIRSLLGGIGLAALVRAATNWDLARLIGMVTTPVIHLSRTVEINAPVAQVYDFWTRFENYSRFMSHVREVQVNEESGLTWVMAGPAGVELKWNSVVTALIPNELIAWKSVSDSLIRSEGRIRLREKSDLRTTISVDLLYALPAGLFSYLIIQLFRFNPRATIDFDLARMRDLIETESGTYQAAAAGG